MTSRFFDASRRLGASVTSFESATTAIAAAVIALQLFVPPVVGMADNGDFAKVAARLCLAPPAPLRDLPERYWRFNIAEYEVAPQHCLEWWQWSSMSIFAWTAKQVHDLGGPESHFDIQVLGGVCAAAWLLCLWGVLRRLRAAPRLVKGIAAVLALVVCTDVLYVAYFHSFYGDCAALIFLFATCAAAWNAAARRSAIAVLAFGACGVLLIWSKGPHVLIAPWLMAFALFWWWRSRLRSWLVTVAVVLVASAASLLAVPEGYGSGTTFNVIFARLLPMSADPVRVLAEFGLPPEAAAFSGEYVYTPTNPYKDPEWRARHAASLAPQRLALFYLRNPQAAARNLWRDLNESATMRLFTYYLDSTPRKPANSLLRWSDVRSTLLREVPWHIPLLYVAMFVSGVALAVRGRQPWQRIGGSLCTAMAGAGATEFAITSLFDALETERHLFIFHALTDLLIVHGALALAWIAAVRVAAQRKPD